VSFTDCIGVCNVYRPEWAGNFITAGDVGVNICGCQFTYSGPGTDFPVLNLGADAGETTPGITFDNCSVMVNNNQWIKVNGSTTWPETPCALYGNLDYCSLGNPVCRHTGAVPLVVHFPCLPDCDSNGTPDVCEDCNTNGVPDGWDFSSSLGLSSPQYSHFGSQPGVPQTFEFEMCGLPDASSAVQLVFHATADIGDNARTKYVDVFLNDTDANNFVASVFKQTVPPSGLLQCRTNPPATKSCSVPAAQWNAAIQIAPDNTRTIAVVMRPTAAVSNAGCGGDPWISVEVSYSPVVPDDCE
jgi:hypothetical protein